MIEFNISLELDQVARDLYETAICYLECGNNLLLLLGLLEEEDDGEGHYFASILDQWEVDLFLKTHTGCRHLGPDGPRFANAIRYGILCILEESEDSIKELLIKMVKDALDSQ